MGIEIEKKKKRKGRRKGITRTNGNGGHRLLRDYCNLGLPSVICYYMTRKHARKIRGHIKGNNKKRRKGRDNGDQRYIPMASVSSSVLRASLE